MIHARDIHENSSWKELTPGGEIYEGGTARMFNTGDWRTDRPVYLADNCRQCLLCAPYCPDGSIPVVDGKRTDFDFDHCKGCGICAKVCPFGAIRMEKEEK
jgi:pyruvate ferredoxin oxidoreductase delta subunit